MFVEVTMSSFSKKYFDEAQEVLQKVKAFDPPLKDQALMKAFEEQTQGMAELYDRISKLRDELTAAVNDKNTRGRQLLKTLRKVKDAVGVQYGYDSNEYELVGRTRDSEHRRRRPHGPESSEGE